MAYDEAAYQADRATMEFPRLLRLEADNIRLKRKRLALDGEKRDQGAIDAACERLLAWRASGEPEPMPPKPSKPDAAALPAVPLEVEAAAVKRLLADQQKRHKHRREAYPHVRPVARSQVNGTRQP